jgi:hypothetical protein
LKIKKIFALCKYVHINPDLKKITMNKKKSSALAKKIWRLSTKKKMRRLGSDMPTGIETSSYNAGRNLISRSSRPGLSLIPYQQELEVNHSWFH